ncbi:extracellular solute-binding protein [Brevibacillus borstelensis AK1]|uniref:Extracellular solute-binding protein n=1 Tax=Brevibacillus borstelensis AK1 TaxID=1300222 RepID=M8DEN4_9BACL|nr:extracellular solute-binding protein [Brevibacillus borstelensis]EMT51933.1 extracellular solute-binding protein [Brevibacillus borstelensis AK1]MCM3556985.1 extracellular solute-binding protein [Brevibacillus borstelensis]MCM3589975.1 extracellular solute-binding protein [Brevibacillus borstelensis]
MKQAMKHAWKQAGALLLMSSLLVVAACGSGGGASTSTQPQAPAGSTTPADNSGSAVKKEVTLSLRHTQIKETSKTRLKILEDVVKKTEEKNPGLKIELEGMDENVNRDQKLKAEMAAGNPPKIFEMFGGADTKLYVKAGRLLDLTDFLVESGLKDKFVNLEEFTVDGRVYGLPIGGYAEGFFYNKKLFAELGLSVPKTWDEFIAVNEKLKAAGKVPLALAAKDGWVNAMLFNTILERNAGMPAIEGLVSGTHKWTDPEMVKALSDYASLVNADFFTKGALGLPYSDQGAQFLRGEAGMVFTGSWDATRYSGDEAGDLKGQIGFFPFPAVSGGKGDQTSINAGYSNGFGFSKDLTEEQKQMVYAFIKEHFNEEVQKRMLVEDRVLPSMKLSDLSGADPLITEVIQTINNASSTWRAYDAVVQPPVKLAVENSLQELIGKVKTPEQVAERLQKEQDKANQSK